jgi:hypothetical protein
MAIILPTLTDGTEDYSFRTQLDGTFFGFDFSWNARGGYWALILSDAAGNALLRRVVRVGALMFNRFRADSRLPLGEIVAMDTSGVDQDPGLTDLGDRVQLLYLTAADLVAA